MNIIEMSIKDCYEHCKKVVVRNDAFKLKIETVGKHTFHIFDYKLATYEDFKKNDAHELRGLTFLIVDGEPVQRFLSMAKFFNFGEGSVQENEEAVASGMKYVQTKEDGSLIIPVVVGTEVMCKTRGTFFSEQALMANQLIANSRALSKWLFDWYAAGLQPLYEYTSPSNKIVLDYKKAELRITQIRNIKTGEYQEFNFDFWKQIPDYPTAVDCIKTDKPWDEFLKETQGLVGQEGYVVTFNNGYMCKIKSDWYCALHHVLTESLMRENDIVALYLDEKLDDALGMIVDTDWRKDYAQRIALAVRGWIVQTSKGVYDILFNELPIPAKRQVSRKDFALKYKSHPMFGTLMLMFGQYEKTGQYTEEEVFDLVIDFVKRKTLKLNATKEWLKSIGFELDNKLNSVEE